MQTGKQTGRQAGREGLVAVLTTAVKNRSKDES